MDKIAGVSEIAIGYFVHRETPSLGKNGSGSDDRWLQVGGIDTILTLFQKIRIDPICLSSSIWFLAVKLVSYCWFQGDGGLC